VPSLAAIFFALCYVSSTYVINNVLTAAVIYGTLRPLRSRSSHICAERGR